MQLLTEEEYIFTLVDAGRPYSVGDATTYAKSSLACLIDEGKWLDVQEAKTISDVVIHPYLVADSAFAFKPHMMKCYADNQPQGCRSTFNRRVILTRRVVEQAFGRLKGRYHFISDPVFAAKVAIVSCALQHM